MPSGQVRLQKIRISYYSLDTRDHDWAAPIGMGRRIVSNAHERVASWILNLLEILIESRR